MRKMNDRLDEFQAPYSRSDNQVSQLKGDMEALGYTILLPGHALGYVLRSRKWGKCIWTVASLLRLSGTYALSH